MNTQIDDASHSIHQFIRFLETQQGASGRANLAELRRAASDPLGDFSSIRILGNYLPDTDGWGFDAYRLVAILFALYAQKFWTQNGTLDLPEFSKEWKAQSFGESLRRLRQQLKVGEESLDLRVSALLDSPQEDIAIPLRNLIQRIADANKPPIPINFRMLLKDLLWWKNEQTPRAWARHYWSPRSTDPLEETSTETNSLTS